VGTSAHVQVQQKRPLLNFQRGSTWLNFPLYAHGLRHEYGAARLKVHFSTWQHLAAVPDFFSPQHFFLTWLLCLLFFQLALLFLPV
jgi:hypothetical protein